MRNQGLQPVSSYQMSTRTVVNSTSSTVTRTSTATSNLRLDNLVVNTPANTNNHYHNNNNGYSSSQASPAGKWSIYRIIVLGSSPGGGGDFRCGVCYIMHANPSSEYSVDC